jgi:single-stranded-DNA-specific exonuclease
MSTPPRIEIRDVHPRVAHALIEAGVSPLLARLLAARGVRDAAELSQELSQLLPPSTLQGTREAGERLADAITRGERICIVADYDCDGATACAVAVRGLRMLGAVDVRYLVPDRRVHGYGLSPTIVDLACAHEPTLLVTVDNGIASVDGVAHARTRGLDVIVTDHHLPALDADAQVLLPDANVIVNPNQPGCGFASKSIAGVGVMFYVLLGTRAVLRERGVFTAATQPRLDRLLDLVALGTVADVVKLDLNNRRLVAKGLERIRARRMQPGIAALFAVAARDASRAAAFDLGFAIGPRLNAAGRLADMAVGIECLLADDDTRANELAQQLDAINRERREVEKGMREQATLHVEQRWLDGDVPPALVVYDESFHEGVVGIVAGRLKDAMHRPCFVFARAVDGTLKGSGRSIEGFHLRDALDLVAKRCPGLLARFGGHAMAAGCTLADGAPASLAAFDGALREVAQAWLDPLALSRRLRTDGSLPLECFDTATVAELDAQVWGQAFEAPLFCDEVEVLGQRVVADKHMKLRVRHHGRERDAIWFGRLDNVPARVRMAFRVAVDEFQGLQRVQMIVEAVEEV